MARFAAITIDVDSIRHYRDIHGLPPVDADEDPIYTVALPRFWELLSNAGLPATLFVIGADGPGHPEAFAPVVPTGSEVASHSFSHDYRLTQRSPGAIEDDLRRADATLRPLNGDRPLVGFRAPGYNITREVLQVVAKLGYRYDSSFLPAPLYWSARAAAIRAYQALGRPSRSLTGSLRQFSGSLRPRRIRPESPFVASSDGPLIEFPMACEPLTRFPLIGTSWTTLPARARDLMLTATLRRLDCLVFEMHAIDLLDGTDHPDLGPLAEAQRDLRVPTRAKMSAFEGLFRRLANAAEVRTLADLSTQPGPTLNP